MKQGFLGKTILKRTLPVYLFVFMLLLNPNAVCFVHGSTGTIANPPLSIGKPVFVTPGIYKLTDKYVVTKDVNGLSFLDIATGEPTQAKDFVDDDCSQTYLQLPDGNQSVKRFTFSQNCNGDEYILTDNAQALRLKDYLIFRYLKKEDGKLLFSVWDANNKNMLWEQEISAPTNEDLSRAEAIDDLLLAYIGNTCYFFDLKTGKQRLAVQPVQLARSERWNNFLLLGKFLIDTDKMTVVREFENESLMLDVGRVYYFSHPEKKESGWYSFVDLSTMEETFFKLDMPHGSYTRGVCSGLFMVLNGKDYSAQIIDPLSAKVYFSHQITETHTRKWGFYENDRQILFFDAAKLFCFDTRSKKLLWEKEFVTNTQDLGNGYFWESATDESTIKVFGLSDPRKSVYVSIDEGHLKPFIFPSESCVLSLDVADQGYTRKLKRYDWDGDVTVLDELPGGNDNLRLPFVFKGMVYAWVESEQTGTLFKYINNQWSKVYQSNVYGWHNNYCQYDRFLAFYCDRNRIKVLNLGTNISKLTETKEKTGICFAGGLLVIVKQFDCVVYNPSTCKVLDEYAGQIACSEKDTLYMVRGQTLKIFSNGKITQTKLDPIAANRQGRFSVSNGLLLADCLLLDREGRFCQELPTSMFGAKLVTVDGKTCIRQDNGSQILIHEVAQSARYSISREPGKIIVKNIGKVKLEGKCWIEPSSNFICAKLKKPIILDIAPGQSAQINLGNSQSMVILKTNGFLDSNYYGQTKQTFKLPDWLGSITSPDGEILSLIETN